MHNTCSTRAVPVHYSFEEVLKLRGRVLQTNAPQLATNHDQEHPGTSDTTTKRSQCSGRHLTDTHLNYRYIFTAHQLAMADSRRAPKAKPIAKFETPLQATRRGPRALLHRSILEHMHTCTHEHVHTCTQNRKTGAQCATGFLAALHLPAQDAGRTRTRT